MKIFKNPKNRATMRAKMRRKKACPPFPRHHRLRETAARNRNFRTDRAIAQRRGEDNFEEDRAGAAQTILKRTGRARQIGRRHRKRRAEICGQAGRTMRNKNANAAAQRKRKSGRAKKTQKQLRNENAKAAARGRFCYASFLSPSSFPSFLPFSSGGRSAT